MSPRLTDEDLDKFVIAADPTDFGPAVRTLVAELRRDPDVERRPMMWCTIAILAVLWVLIVGYAALVLGSEDDDRSGRG